MVPFPPLLQVPHSVLTILTLIIARTSTSSITTIVLPSSGGLTPDNVGEAAVTAGVMGVDVSSGIEQTGKPGVKDVSVMKSFIANARS